VEQEQEQEQEREQEQGAGSKEQEQEQEQEQEPCMVGSVKVRKRPLLTSPGAERSLRSQRPVPGEGFEPFERREA
jgi:hypothetical protein